MIVAAKPDYETARAATVSEIKSRFTGLIGTIGYLNKESKGSLPDLREYLEALDFRISLQAMAAGNYLQTDLPYLEHHSTLYQRLLPIFEQQVATITAMPDLDGHVLKTIGDTRSEAKQLVQKLQTFASLYVHEIDQERGSPAYAQHKQLIEKAVGEFEAASKLGQWTPEYTELPGSEPERPRMAETPDSVRMGTVAAMAPKLRALGFTL